MERKLASLKIIKDIIPIEGADSVEIAVVDGWKVVVSKDKHKRGELVIYCEVDSFLPIREEFEFLRKNSYKKMGDKEGFRLRTIKIRGQVSQGLILSLNEIFGDFSWTAYEGIDVTERLGIIKYEPPVPPQLTGIAKGNFPSFIPKTDEERIQNLSQKYGILKTKKYCNTEKLDGSSSTFYYNNGKFGVCSRNLELIESDTHSMWKFARENDIEDKLRNIGRNIALQGEIIGEGIQGNPYKIKGQTVKFFKAFDIDNQEYLEYNEFVEFILNKIKCDVVPLIDREFTLPEDIFDLINLGNGKSIINPQINREGIVLHSTDGELSFKIISNEYLLKNQL